MESLNGDSIFFPAVILCGPLIGLLSLYIIIRIALEWRHAVIITWKKILFCTCIIILLVLLYGAYNIVSVVYFPSNADDAVKY